MNNHPEGTVPQAFSTAETAKLYMFYMYQKILKKC